MQNSIKKKSFTEGEGWRKEKNFEKYSHSANQDCLTSLIT